MAINYIGLMVLGLVVGALSGLAGIGGGIFLIPALVLFFGFTQHQAVGTTLAVMVPPVTLAAALEYYRRGHVDLKITLLLTLAVFLGSWATARFAHQVPEVWLKRLFGTVLLLASLRFLSAR
jgi:uncharacterized membrane protein YfcA